MVSCWTGKINISLSPFAPDNLVSRNGFGHSVLRVSLIILHTQTKSGTFSRDSSRFPRQAASFIYLYRHMPSGPSRVYRVITQLLLRTDDVHCRESAGTGPVVLKVVPGTGAVFAGHHGPIDVRLSFPTPTKARSFESKDTGSSSWRGFILSVFRGWLNLVRIYFVIEIENTWWYAKRGLTKMWPVELCLPYLTWSEIGNWWWYVLCLIYYRWYSESF